MNAHWGERSMTEMGQLLKLVELFGYTQDFT